MKRVTREALNFMGTAKLAVPEFSNNIQTILFLLGGQLCKPSQGGRWWKEVGGKDGWSPMGLLGHGLNSFSLARKSSMGSLQCQGGFAQQTWRSWQPSEMLSPRQQHCDRAPAGPGAAWDPEPCGLGAQLWPLAEGEAVNL